MTSGLNNLHCSLDIRISGDLMAKSGPAKIFQLVLFRLTAPGSPSFIRRTQSPNVLKKLLSLRMLIVFEHLVVIKTSTLRENGAQRQISNYYCPLPCKVDFFRMKVKKYLGLRISRYPNSTSTFPLSCLTISGDICPNPGPSGTSNF